MFYRIKPISLFQNQIHGGKTGFTEVHELDFAWWTRLSLVELNNQYKKKNSLSAEKKYHHNISMSLINQFVKRKTGFFHAILWYYRFKIDSDWLKTGLLN